MHGHANLTNLLGPPSSKMAAAVASTVDHHGLIKPPILNRRCRLRSYPHPDPAAVVAPSPAPPPSGRCFRRSLSTPCFTSTSTTFAADHRNHHPRHQESSSSRIAKVEIVGGRHAPGIHSLVVEAAIAMASGAQLVQASSSGLGGAYILRNNRTGESFAVVKPVDEAAPLARWRPCSSGEPGAREAAAYLLDHGGFSGVPTTALIKFFHPSFHGVHSPTSIMKMASIQRYVPHEFAAGDVGPSRFSISSVHRIGILDVRLLNVDRHAGNILVRKSSDGELVPIDHGLCLPESVEDPYFEWLHWPQASVPFSEPESSYISGLDPFSDAELLRSELPSMISEPSLRVLILCTIFLKRAAGAGLCLADIGGMMTRGVCEEGPSDLEALCKEVMDSMNIADDDDDEEDDSHDVGDHQIFQFDDDNEGGFSSAIRMEKVLGIPPVLRNEPEERDQLKVLLQSPATDEEIDVGRNVMEGAAASVGEDHQETIMRSVSFPSGRFSYEFDGGGEDGFRAVSFKGLQEGEWRVFLERFEELLPEAFEARLSIAGPKQRLGSSCKF